MILNHFLFSHFLHFLPVVFPQLSFNCLSAFDCGRSLRWVRAVQSAPREAPPAVGRAFLRGSLEGRPLPCSKVAPPPPAPQPRRPSEDAAVPWVALN